MNEYLATILTFGGILLSFCVLAVILGRNSTNEPRDSYLSKITQMYH